MKPEGNLSDSDAVRTNDDGKPVAKMEVLGKNSFFASFGEGSEVDDGA